MLINLYFIDKTAPHKDQFGSGFLSPHAEKENMSETHVRRSALNSRKESRDQSLTKEAVQAVLLNNTASLNAAACKHAIKNHEIILFIKMFVVSQKIEQLQVASSLTQRTNLLEVVNILATKAANEIQSKRTDQLSTRRTPTQTQLNLVRRISNLTSAMRVPF